MKYVEHDGILFSREPWEIELSSLDEFGFPEVRYYNRGKILWLPDQAYSMNHRIFDELQRNKLISEFKLMTGLLSSDILPENLVLSEEWDEGGSLIFEEDVGRFTLIQIAGHLRIPEVLDDLYKVAIYNPDYLSKLVACEAMGRIGGKKAANYLCDIIAIDENEVRDDAARALLLLDEPSISSRIVSQIQKSYDEILEGKYNASNYRYNIDALTYCFEVLGKIPSLESLKGIELGLKMNFAEPNRWAHVALDNWINYSLSQMAHGVVQYDYGERIDLIRKLIIKYGVDSHKDFYDSGKLASNLRLISPSRYKKSSIL